MHVALLCEYGTVNGGENSILAMIEHLPSIQVSVIAPATGRLAARIADAGLRHLPISLHDDAGRRFPRAAILQQLREIVEQLCPDLLHANSLSMGRMTGALGESFAVPRSAHLRDIIGLNRSAIEDLNNNDALIAVSRATRDFHVGQGLDPSRTVVIYNGISEASSTVRSTTPLSEELGIAPSTPIVATIGQISLRKGQDLFVEAAIRTSLRLPDVHWIIIGERFSTKSETIEFDEQLRRRVRDAGLSDRIHWLGYRDDVPRLLSEIDLIVHSARQEPLGRVLLEAAAAGVPIVATDVGGTREILESNKTAILVPPDAPDDLANAIAWLMQDSELRQSLSAAARKDVTQRFAVEARAADLVDVWNRIVSGD